MTKEELQSALEAIARGGINVKGDLVLEKHVEYEVDNVEAGGIGIQVTKGTPSGPTTTLPPELASPTATIYWQRLHAYGFVGVDHSLAEGTSRTQAAYMAMKFDFALHLSNKWKMFERLWGMKNLRQAYGQIKNINARLKMIDEAFDKPV